MSNQQLPPLFTSAPPDDLAMHSPDGFESRGRVRKPFPNNHQHVRSASAQIPPPSESLRPRPQDVRHSYLDGTRSGAASPLAPPPAFLGDRYPNSRASSMEYNRSRPGTPTSYNSRPATPNVNVPGQQVSSRPGTPSGNKEGKKGGLLKKGKKDKDEDALPPAWIAGDPKKQAYDVTSLINGRPMSELWDDTDGNCLVYLFPRSSGKGPSFKIDSAVFASSPVLTRLAFGDLYSNAAIQSGGDRRHQLPLEARTQNLSLYNDPTTPPMSPRQKHRTPAASNSSPTSSLSSRGRFSNVSDPPAETHLYLPVQLHNPQEHTQTPPRSSDSADPAAQDLQTLIDIRNFFAFLSGSSLVATSKKASFFHIFMTVSGILKTYEFSNLDGSAFGEVANGSFDNYVQELGLADVRHSREKTIEGIVLGERMKSVLLYNEAFVHAAGKHEDLINLKSPKFSLMSSVTDNRLIRAAMDLDQRVASAQLILHDFEFPALFTGIMASKTSDVRKEGVRFENWKESFLGFRKNYLGMLKHQWGDWPPRAKSKKNDLETSGLNRLVLRGMYNDMCSLYDLLVDRQSLTSRTVDGINLAGARGEEPTTRALRAVLSEYDRSSPPVKPPVPFDLPILPKIQSLQPNFGQDKQRDIKLLQRKLKDDEVSQVLLQSWNKDALANTSPFLQSFWEMEKRAAHGCTISELIDLRIGQWVFMYVVLQALPMLACDAPGLKWKKGVEYFLCEPPRKGVPWANPNAPSQVGGALNNSGPVGRTWFSVGEGEGVVSLPADVVEHGVEGIYKRSHCWVMAEKWTRENPVMNEALHVHEAQNAASEEARYMQEQSAQRQRPVSSSYFTQPTTTTAGFSPPLGGYNGLLAPGNTPGNRTSKRHSSLGLGLEALPLPMGVTPDGSTPTGYQSPGGGTPQERPRTAVDTTKTFDAILASVDQEPKKGKKK